MLFDSTLLLQKIHFTDIVKQLNKDFCPRMFTAEFFDKKAQLLGSRSEKINYDTTDTFPKESMPNRSGLHIELHVPRVHKIICKMGRNY